MNIYICEAVQQIRDLQHDIILKRLSMTSVFDELAEYSNNLAVAFKEQNPACKFELGCWHQPCLGKAFGEMLAMDLSDDDFRATTARGYGFKDWAQVDAETRNVTHDEDLENGIDMLLAGDKSGLQSLIDSNPGVLETSSRYGHRARLIHYAGSNGVETWRQVVPENLTEMLQMLIDAGADPSAPSQIYGGGCELSGLINSSAHPRDAGIMKELLAVLDK